jgi:hypothetical protein
MKTKTLKKAIKTALLSGLALLSMSFSISATQTTPAITTYPEETTTTTTAPTYDTLPPYETGEVFTEGPPDVLGNAELVEERHMIFSNGTVDFFAITTRKGNVFYVFIDRTTEEDPNVYFLNKVDEIDMLNILYPPTTDNSGNVITQTLPVGEDNEPGDVITAFEEETSKAPAVTKKKSPISTMNIVILAILGVGLIIFAFIYFARGKKKSPPPIDDEEILEDDNFYTEDENGKSPF